MKPKIAITMGDPAGIGPEIIIDALGREDTYQKCCPLVCGDAGVMALAAERFGKGKLKVNAIEKVDEAKFEYGCIDVVDLHCIDLDTFKPGVVAEQCGNAAFVSVVKAIDMAMKKEVDATVTAPLNKEALNLAGHHFDGHTEIYATYTGTKKYAMLSRLTRA